MIHTPAGTDKGLNQHGYVDVLSGRWGVVFGVVICEIMGSLLPIEEELILCLTATEPVQSEPNHFGFALDDGVGEIRLQ